MANQVRPSVLLTSCRVASKPTEKPYFDKKKYCPKRS
jgi:hypothetical protein